MSVKRVDYVKDIEKIDPAIKSKISKQTKERIEKRISKRFLSFLAIISIIGFSGIAFKTLFEIVITEYLEVLWIIILGAGLILEADLKSLAGFRRTGLDSNKFSKLVTAVVGFLAIITGLLILPQVGWVTPGLLAVQGVISLVAIIFIIVETWILRY